MSWLFNSAIDWLAHVILDLLNALWGLLLEHALNIPNVTKLPQVKDITATCLLVVNISFVLAIIGAGMVVMGRETLQTRYGIAELGPRLVVGFIAANISTLLCDKLITVANAVIFELAGQSLSTTGSFNRLHDTVQAAFTNAPTALLTVVFAVVLAGLTGMLLMQWLVRLGLLVVLVGAAPIALACHATPFTDPAAKLWWRAILGTVGTVVAQAFALHTAMSIFLNPAVNVSALGIPDKRTHAYDLFIVTCLLWAVLKIPGLMRRYVTKGSTGAGGAGLGRLVIVHQLTRTLTRVITKVPVRAPTGAAGRAAGGGGGAAAGGRIGGPRPRPINSGGASRIPPPRPGGRGHGPSPRPTGRGAPQAGVPSGPRTRAGRPNPAPAPRPTSAAGRRTNPPFANGRTAAPPPRSTAPRPTPPNRRNPNRRPPRRSP